MFMLFLFHAVIWHNTTIQDTPNVHSQFESLEYSAAVTYSVNTVGSYKQFMWCYFFPLIAVIPNSCSGQNLVYHRSNVKTAAVCYSHSRAFLKPFTSFISPSPQQEFQLFKKRSGNHRELESSGCSRRRLLVALLLTPDARHSGLYTH